MPFIGNQPALSYTSFAKQDFTTSATTSYTLDNPVANANELALFINFVRQEPTTAYSASGTSLTLTSATSASDDMYCVFLGKAVQTVNPPNSSVGSSQVSADLITGQTALGATPADTDELLISDAGTLKRVDFSYLKTGITMAQQWRLNSNFTCNNNNQTVDGWEAADQTGSVAIGSAMTYSSGVFTFPSTGIYEITQTIVFGSSDYNDTNVNVVMQLSTDTGSNYITQSLLWIGYESGAGGNPPSRQTSNQSIIMDVTNTSTNRFRIQGSNGDGTNAFFEGNSGYNSTMLLFKRIGDT